MAAVEKRIQYILGKSKQNITAEDTRGKQQQAYTARL